MLKRIIFLLTMILLCTYCIQGYTQQSDSTYVIGKRYTIQSSLLNESRKYWVRLPQNYNPKTQYPVIYVLDGEMYFPIVSAEQGFLDGNRRLSKNKCIVVAIENTDRTRDLTPTPAISMKGQGTMENSGKGEVFFQFLEKELIPSIETQYSTAKRRILIGHSFGGLVASYFLLQHPACFTDYLIMEPALWWDDGKLLKSAKDLLVKNTYPDSCHIFFAFARQMDTTNASSIDRIVTSLHPQNVITKSQYYPAESHGTVYIHALYDGLRFIFDFVVPVRSRNSERSRQLE